MTNDKTADPVGPGAPGVRLARAAGGRVQDGPEPLRNPSVERVEALRNPSMHEARDMVSALYERVCEDCGDSFGYDPVGRPQRFCSAACRQRAYRRRKGRPERMAPEPYWSDEQSALYVGDSARVLELMPSASVQTVVTSPPYFGLRDYEGHPEQLGQEPTPGEYVDALLDVFAGIERVLRPDGTVWLNLGDTYSGRANARRSPGSDRTRGRAHRPGVIGGRSNTTATARNKSLLMMPARVAIALADAGWIVRNDVVWHKTNAMPESVTDRLSTRHEHLFLLTKAERYYFDLDAIKVAASGRAGGNKDREAYATAIGTDAAARRYGANPGSTLATKEFTERNPGDVWSIATRPSAEAHFAMFPPELPTRCIQASSRPGDVVLDPFSGAGTTGVVARMLSRRYVGIDLSAGYHDLAATKLAATFPTIEAS